MDVKRKLAQLARDGTVTNAEWKTLAAEVAASPPKANATARAVLDLWANDSLTIDITARLHMRDYLRSCGYPVPDLENPTPSMVPDIIRGNVSEPDVEFERLSKAVLRAKATTTIAVLDTGFDTEHPELANKAWKNAAEVPGNGLDDDHDGLIDDVRGWDFVDQDGGLKSGDFHGTHVSGIATAGTDRVKAISCRVIGPISGQRVADAIDFAAAKGARVINMSLALDTPEDVKLVRAAIARHPDLTFVKSAGNDGAQLGTGRYSPDQYLAAVELPNLLVIAAANADGTIAEYSNRGAPYAQLAARGTGVLSTSPDGKYVFDDGTSMATPEVTSALAKALALNPRLTVSQLRALVMATADAHDAWKGAVAAGGTLDEVRALRVAALTQLLSSGKTGAEAAAQLKLSDEERAELVPMATLVLRG